jgi:hypothetical protein
MIDEAQLDIARIALQAAGDKFEVALAGGVALQVRDKVDRKTEDVDLFIRRKSRLPGASKAIIKALIVRGYQVMPVPGIADSSDSLLDLVVVPPQSNRQIPVQLAYFDGVALESEHVGDVGPVVTLRYAGIRKTHAMLERNYPRDFGDVAALVTPGRLPDGSVRPADFSVFELIKWENEASPDHDERHVGYAMRQLDQMADTLLQRDIPVGWTPTRVREAFAEVPRSPSLDESDFLS